MYPHKATVKIWRKKFQKKWKNAYLTVKNARASRALVDIILLHSPDFALQCLQNLGQNFWAPLDQSLYPLVVLSIKCLTYRDATTGGGLKSGELP